MKPLITAELVSAAFAGGTRSIAAPRGQAIITPAAWSRAFELGVSFEQAEAAPAPGAQPTPPPGCERVVDPSGLVLVRGQTVQLGRFPGAGPGREVGLTDVIGGRDASPMTAGFMSWRQADSFPWTLDYAEIDYVVDGVFHLGIEGRVLEGRPGDVLYLPKGSRVVFGTPSHTRLFYVTYPADWQSAAPLR